MIDPAVSELLKACFSFASGLLQEILIGSADAFFEGDLWRPAQGVEAGGVHELAGCAVGLGGIPMDRSRVSEDSRHRLGQFADG